MAILLAGATGLLVVVHYEAASSERHLAGSPDRTLMIGDKYTLIGADGRPYESATPGLFGGHRGTRVYGRLDCPSALRAIAAVAM